MGHRTIEGHPRTSRRYSREYIDYLRASGYLTEDVEDVELEDFQGVQGLKALRVTVAMPPAAPDMCAVPAAVESPAERAGPWPT
jgi:hypothetical protein